MQSVGHRIISQMNIGLNMNAYILEFIMVSIDIVIYICIGSAQWIIIYKYPNDNLMWSIILGMGLPVVFDSQETHRNNKNVFLMETNDKNKLVLCT